MTPPTRAPDDRLTRLLGGEDLAWLRERIRRRLERGLPVDGTVVLSTASEAQRAAVARLLGRAPGSGAGLSVSLPAVDEVLRRSGAHPGGLAAAVIALDGPVRDRAGEAAAQAAQWRAAFAVLDQLAAGRPELAAWAVRVNGSGLLRRLARDPATARLLLTDLAACVGALPAGGELIGAFAERVLGSAHALDDDRPLTTLLFGAARVLSDCADGTGSAWRREVWAGVGLLRDELSSTVLALGLPGNPSGPTARVLAELGEVGEPAVLTLRQLRRHPPTWRLHGVTVSVCENPVVVATAADRLGSGSAPVVCVQGQPGVAAMLLLRLLAEAGAELRLHADFDWGGLRIGNAIAQRLPVRPWRFDAATYRALVAAGAGRELAGHPVDAMWDEELAPAMRGAGRAIEEERMLDALVADLG